MVRPLSRRTFISAAATGGVGIALARNARSQAQPADALPSPDAITVTDPALLSAVEAASLLQSGQLAPRELLDACLARSRALDGDIGAWVRIYPDVAYAAADAAGERLSQRATNDQGPAPLVCGLPIGLKDLYAVAGLPVTASSRVLEGNIAAGDAGVWKRLSDAGMVLMGHTHTHEFAIGIATSQVGNPWDTTKSPGGSSGGSAAALAAGFMPLGTGTDTGGSLRIPASACGISSIKPTYGRCSTAGIIPLTWSRDHSGPMARSVADASLLLSYMAGPDEADPSTGTGPEVPSDGYPMVARGGAAPMSGIRLGIPRNAVGNLPDALSSLFDEALVKATQLGADVVDVEMPDTPTSLLIGDQIEMGSYHQQFSTRLGLYEPDNALIVGGTVVALASPVSDYISLERDRYKYQRDYNRMFADAALDAIVLPGALVDGSTRGQLKGFSVFDGVGANSIWANYAGVPVVAMPVGRSTKTGLPFGIQIGGLPWQESTVIRIGLELEMANPDWRGMPELPARPRAIPEVTRTSPGPGPEATNTRSDPPGLYAIPTLSTRW